MTKELYTINDFCKAFNISRPTFYKLKKEGKIKTITIGQRIRIASEEVERLKKEGV